MIMKYSIRLGLLPFALIILVLSGCGQDHSNLLPPLLGQEWLLSDMEGRPVQLVDGLGQPTLVLIAGQASGISGINHFIGSYDLDGANLTFGSMAGTRMAGPPEAMEIEQAYLSGFEEIVTWVISDRQLILFDLSGRAVMIFDVEVD